MVVKPRFQVFIDTPGAKEWVREFWHARDSYEFYKTRSVTNTGRAEDRMNKAVDALCALGLFPEGVYRTIPTLDQMDGRDV